MRTPSVPHISFGRLVVIVPSCRDDVPWGRRCGDSKAFSRIRRSTRVRETRMSRRIRSRAHTLRLPLTGKGRGRQIGADGLQKVSVGHLWFRAAPLRHEWHHVARLACLTGIDRRTRESKHPADPLQPIRLAGASGGRAAHFDDLRLPKGCRACLCLRRISTSMTSSPMRRVASPSFASSGSFSRSLRPASIPARARSRHSSSLYIGTDTSREMASTGSPRNRRRTTSFFLLADQRFTSAAAPGALPVALRAPSTAPDTTSATFDFFSIFNSVSRHRFYPKFVSRKIGGGSELEVILHITTYGR